MDDQEGILLLLKEVFRKEWFETYLANRGIEAIQIIELVKMDVVLLVLKLPLMDGKEVLKLLKERSPDIPVVMMSAYEETVVKMKFLKLVLLALYQNPR